MKKWLKENWDALLGVILVLILVVTNIGSFIVAMIGKDLNYWDVMSLVSTLSLIALLSYTVARDNG